MLAANLMSNTSVLLSKAVRASCQLGAVRWVRRNVQNNNAPADFIADATTYADKHAVILDPHSPLPYNPIELKDMITQPKLTQKAAALARSKAKFNRRYLLNLNFDHIPIENQIVLMFPGQGAQFVGMSAKFGDTSAGLRLFEQASQVLGYDVLDVCRRGPNTKLDQTIYCQTAIFVSSMAAMENLLAEQPDVVDRITEAAGFSIGEYCALVVSNVLSFEDALKVIKVRAEAMHECSQLVKSGMITIRVNAASLLDEAMFDARESARELGDLAICDVANFLYCGVKVIGGTQKSLNFLRENAERYKFKVVKQLAVGGAFHTKLMADAEPQVAKILEKVEVKVPRVNIYSNYTGKIYPRHQKKIRDCIIKQISRPLKWEQIIQLLYRKHQNYIFPSYFEVGPGKQLGAILHQVSKKAYANYVNYPC